MRILLVSHPPLSPESGAAQLALNLEGALRSRGHDAVAWSPEPLDGARWWDRWLLQRRAIETYVAESGPFDVIDLPAVSVSRQLARAAVIVARSTQPELLYLTHELADQLRRRPPSPRFPFHAAASAVLAGAVVRGWRRSRWILCLGSLELDWMRRRFPALRPRLRRYLISPPSEDRAALAEVRRRRETSPQPPGVAENGTRFLWIGRWTAHKGTGRLARFLHARAASHPRDRFTIAGCGSDAACDLAPELVAGGRVRIVPSFRREELPALLAAHDAGLFTSVAEGWGISLNEMLEAGLTVYATPAGGVVDLAPYWGDRLRPFPPPARPLPPGPEPDPEGYRAELSWPTIARRYEEEVLLCG